MVAGMSDSMYTSASGVGHSIKEDNEAKDKIDGTGLNDTNTKGGKLEAVELSHVDTGGIFCLSFR